MPMPSIELLDLRGRDRPELLSAFTALYLNTFTDPSEREDPAQWSERLRHSYPSPQPRTHLVVALQADGVAASSVLGGIVFEYYPASRCGLLTYLVVDRAQRRRGLARRLISTAIGILNHDAQQQSSTLRGVFAEAEDPAKVSAEDAAMSPRERVTALMRLGARWIDIPYVQPALDGGSGRCRHLLLLAFDHDGTQPEGIQGSVVKGFLYEFYQALGIERPDADADYVAISRRLDATLPLKPYAPPGTTT